MIKRICSLALIAVLLVTMLSSCGQRSDQGTWNGQPDNTTYESIQNGLVGETKILARRIAEFACSDDISLYVTDEEALHIASSFAQAVIRCEKPLSAKRYIIDQSSLNDDHSGGALSHGELISYYVKSYPLLINNEYGINAVAAASAITEASAYRKPTDFSGVQIIELKYSADFGVFAVYTETENETVQCAAYPIFGEIEDGSEFSAVASSGDLGITLICSEYSCDAAVDCSLADCKMRTGNFPISDDPEVSAAQSAMRSVSKRANSAYLSMADIPDRLCERCLSCEIYASTTPSHAIVWSGNDFLDICFDICGMDIERIHNRSLFETKFAQSFSTFLCGAFANSETVASQSIMSAATSFVMSEVTEPVIVCLLYEYDDGIFAGMVSICPVGNGCVFVNASPIWNLSIIYDMLGFYDSGRAITAYSESFNDWLMSGKYLKIN